MASILYNLREEVSTRVSLKKTASGFVFNDFDVETGWFDYDLLDKLEEDHPQGLVFIAGMVADVDSNKSRSNLSMREVPVMVGYKRMLTDPFNNSALDVLEEFMDELTEICRLEVNLEGYSWTRTEWLKDESGLPLGFQAFQQNLFAGWFTAYFNFVLQP